MNVPNFQPPVSPSKYKLALIWHKIYLRYRVFRNIDIDVFSYNVRVDSLRTLRAEFAAEERLNVLSVPLHKLVVYRVTHIDNLHLSVLFPGNNPVLVNPRAKLDCIAV